MESVQIAVLGGDRFVGSHVGRCLRRAGMRARGSYRGTSPGWHVDDLDWSWQPVTCDKRAQVRRFVKGATAVIHCAGYVPEGTESIGDARCRGVEQIRAVADACVAEDVARLVYVSSHTTAWTKEAQQSGIDETSRYVPGSVSSRYFEAKAAMEAELYRYVAGGLDAVIAMPSVVMGPGDRDSVTSRFVSRVAGGGLRVMPKEATINAVDGRDVAEAVVAVLRRGRRGRRYLLGGHNVDIAKFVEMIASAGRRRLPPRAVSTERIRPIVEIGERIAKRVGIGGSTPLSVATDRAVCTGDLSSRRAREELQFQPRSLETTIDDAVRWLARAGYLSWTPERGTMAGWTGRHCGRDTR